MKILELKCSSCMSNGQIYITQTDTYINIENKLGITINGNCLSCGELFTLEIKPTMNSLELASNLNDNR